MIRTAEILTELPSSCKHEISATWAQKIRAIGIAAANVSDEQARERAVLLVKRNLAEGVEHMTYKDFNEFDCSCEEQYIFGEAVHLIEELNLPFNEALNSVLHEDCYASGGKGACVDRIERSNTVANLVKPANVVETVKQLRYELDQLAEALEWATSQSEAEPLESQRRMLQAMLTAIKAEYAPGYFD